MIRRTVETNKAGEGPRYWKVGSGNIDSFEQRKMKMNMEMKIQELFEFEPIQQVR